MKFGYEVKILGKRSLNGKSHTVTHWGTLHPDEHASGPLDIYEAAIIAAEHARANTKEVEIVLGLKIQITPCENQLTPTIDTAQEPTPAH